MTKMDRICAKYWLAYISNIVRHCDYVCVCALMRRVCRTENKQCMDVIVVL